MPLSYENEHTGAGLQSIAAVGGRASINHIARAVNEHRNSYTQLRQLVTASSQENVQETGSEER